MDEALSDVRVYPGNRCGKRALAISTSAKLAKGLWGLCRRLAINHLASRNGKVENEN